jgi:hypothetical protein
MNVIRETVRVVIEELEKTRLLDKCPPHVRKDQPIGREAISDYLGGPWKEMYQIRLIGEALAQLRDMEIGIDSKVNRANPSGLAFFVPQLKLS